MVPSAIEWIQAQLCDLRIQVVSTFLPGRKGLEDAALREAVARAEKGQIDADLGGEVHSNAGCQTRAGENRKATAPSSCSGAEPGAFFV